MNQRDKRILKMLNHFRVLSRIHLEQIICPEAARPSVTVNRVMKRMSRDGLVTVIPQPKDQVYLYMPNPPIILIESSKTRHFLGLADLFITLRMPNIYEVEPPISESYQPDVYTRIPRPIIIEYQRTRKHDKYMQAKVDNFVRSNRDGQHDSKEIWVVTEIPYKLKIPTGFELRQMRMEDVPVG